MWARKRRELIFIRLNRQSSFERFSLKGSLTSLYNARMAMQVDTAVTRQEAAKVGESLYQECLQSALEPAHNGQLVAIHLPSKEYFLGESLLEVSDRLREKYPHAGPGEVYARGVGDRSVVRIHSPRVTRT